MRTIILICGTVLLVTCIGFFFCELYIFRKSTVEKLTIINGIISSQSTAALAFQDREAATEILQALKNEPHITRAALYDSDGNLFATYPANAAESTFPQDAQIKRYHFSNWNIEGVRPVMQEKDQLGALFISSDLGAMYSRFKIFAVVMAIVIILSFPLAILVSKIVRKSISEPVLSLSSTAEIIKKRRDYSVRALKAGQDELGLLTDAFNSMLDEIEEQNRALNIFNQNLEQKVKERTIQLESVNKELEAFSYSISHDLRAPLRGIIGFTTILEEDYGSRLDDEAKRITGVIKNNTLKMGHLIDDLLTFSRMGRQDIVKTNIAMDRLVSEVVKDAAEGKDGKIEWNIQQLPDAMGDMNALRQVWINLISNAIKYSGNEKKIHIDIGSFAQDGQIVYYVKDNGVGFDEKYRGKLFRVFQRLHSPNEFEGTGVGLAIVEKIVSKHGGTVSAEGKVNGGATFYFSLPANS
jgi:signal transduction histidine kinase